MDMETAVRKMGGVWPPYSGLAPEDGKPDVLFSAAALDLLYISNGPGKPSTGRRIGTHTEFDECARRLRNEPSFNDHPDAKCFVQNMDGKWFKNTKTTTVIQTENMWYSSIGGWVDVQQGEVIGDWKRTLRLRPEEKIETQGETNLCESCVLNEICNMPKIIPVCRVHSCNEYEEKEVEENSVRYSLFGNSLARRRARVKRLKEMAVEAELNRRENEVPSAPDNDWHAKGEFPPVGTVCEVFPWFHACESVAPHRDGMVMHDRHNDEYFLATKNTRFRPIQTERDRLTEKALGMTRDTNSVTEAVCILRDANMLKMPEEKPE